MQFFAEFAANLANFAETKSWYGEGTELVRRGSSDDILWGGLQKHGKKFGRYQIFSYICTVLKDKCYENSSRLYSNN